MILARTNGIPGRSEAASEGRANGNPEISGSTCPRGPKEEDRFTVTSFPRLVLGLNIFSQYLLLKQPTFLHVCFFFDCLFLCSLIIFVTDLLLCYA